MPGTHRSGRKPKPAALHALHGTKRADRQNQQAPIPAPAAKMPPAPEHLNDVAKKEWQRLGPQLLKLKVYTDIDWTAFSVYCVLFARGVRLGTTCNESELTIVGPAGEKANPVFVMERQNYGLLRSYLSEFGLTPSTRARIVAGVGDEEEVDPFAKHEGGFRPKVVPGGRK